MRIRGRSVAKRIANPRKPLHKWLAMVAQISCVLGIAYVAANSAHFFWTGPPTTAPAPVAVRAPASDQADIPLAQLRTLHLFGRPRANVAPKPAENLQETKLSLSLVGVFVGQGTASMALIARQGRPPESYMVGDRLPGNAKLEAVHADRVVISRDGVRELIRFGDQARHFRPVSDGRAAPPATFDPPSAAPATEKSPAEDLISRHWEELEQDPAKLLRDLGVGSATGDGAGKGYALGALAERPELNHTGLRAGDQLLSVNGHPVGDPEQDRLRLKDLAAHGSLRLEIQRGERRMFITVAL